MGQFLQVGLVTELAPRSRTVAALTGKTSLVNALASVNRAAKYGFCATVFEHYRFQTTSKDFLTDQPFANPSHPPPVRAQPTSVSSLLDLTRSAPTGVRLTL